MPQAIDSIVQKINAFIRKFYVNDLIRGAILFFAIGLLFLILTAAIEYFFWLSSTGRTILFWLFIASEAALLYRFLLIPLLRLFKLRKGLDLTTASTLIGEHFPEVGDRLTNVLQLHSAGAQEELVAASIAQKTKQLSPIKFERAINLSGNKKYLKYALIPIAIIALLLVTDQDEKMVESYERVVNYEQAYVPPAPFEFFVVNDDLSVLQGNALTVNVRTAGDVVPDEASIQYGGQSYFLTQESPGTFSYTFEQLDNDLDFVLRAGDVTSAPYQIDVHTVPVIQAFEMKLDYPSYTARKDETLQGTGNATVPTGTRVTWTVTTENAERVQFQTRAGRIDFNKGDDRFAFAKAITTPINYSIATSNRNVQDYEELAFQLDVIRDEYPKLALEMKVDSTDTQMMLFRGEASDDYGLRSLKMLYYADNNPQDVQTKVLDVSQGTFDSFYAVFPGELKLIEGESYSVYFELQDNDGTVGGKSTKSRVYNYRERTTQEKEDENLQQQQQGVDNLQKQLQDQKAAQKQLEQLSQDQREKSDRDFNDTRKLQQQMQQMQQQQEKLQDNLRQLEKNLKEFNDSEDPFKKNLEERIEQSQEEIQKNKELMEELEKYADKIEQEELNEKLEEAQQNSKKQERNLEQMLELTKRYYVEQKAAQLADKLDRLADKQLEQAKKPESENTKAEQDALNKEFEEWRKEMDELIKENDALEKPMEVGEDISSDEDIKRDQEGASEELDDSDGEKNTGAAQQKQRSAGQKMKARSAAMKKEQMSGGGEQMQEDADSLRQILDNLLVYSFEEEDLLENFDGIDNSHPEYARNLKRQKELEIAFSHVDDSLFALSKRNPELGQEVNAQVTDIYYYMEKAMAQLSENEVFVGRSSQQYATTGANALAYMLTKALDNMNNAMSQPGKGESGQGSGFQLPDIIKKQKSLSEQMGQEGQEGKEGQQGESGESGESGQSGQAGESGQSGQQGQNGQQGEGQGQGQGQESGQGKGGQGGEGQGGENGRGKGQGQGEGGQNGQQSGQGQNGKAQNGKSGSDGRGGQGGEQGANGEQGYGNTEEESARLYDIYKQQQDLRNQLEDRLQKAGLAEKYDKLISDMKEVEQDILERGFNRDTQAKMTEIEHQLMKLDDASLMQGEENRREGTTNTRSYDNPTNNVIPDASQFFNRQEILNRQALPLQQQYKDLVKQYFQRVSGDSQ